MLCRLEAEDPKARERAGPHGGRAWVQLARKSQAGGHSRKRALQGAPAPRAHLLQQRRVLLTRTRTSAGEEAARGRHGGHGASCSGACAQGHGGAHSAPAGSSRSSASQGHLDGPVPRSRAAPAASPRLTCAKRRVLTSGTAPPRHGRNEPMVMLSPGPLHRPPWPSRFRRRNRPRAAE